MLSAEITSLLVSFVPPLLAVGIGGLVLRVSHRLLIGRHPEMGQERAFSRQLIMLLLTLIVLIAVILSLPISDGYRNNLLGIIGLIFSGLIAFSSTTIVANLTAGIMLRVTKPFRMGDFIEVDQHFGRISERGLLDTEIQTEHRDLIALPNTYLITNPVKTVRASGTIVSVSLSLGYDEHHGRIEKLLIKAATASGLVDPFVQILTLGDYAITYRAAGLLTDVKSLITTRSNLNRAILDTLHEAGVEIASPAIMNQRRIPEDRKLIPVFQGAPEASSPEKLAENLAFDKADLAEERERQLQIIKDQLSQIDAQLSETPGADLKAPLLDRQATLKADANRLQQSKEANDPDHSTA